jgi:alpha-ketoglutarate-dependent taurine dioxygenase
MKDGFIEGLERMPLVIEPAAAAEARLEPLFEWCAAQRDWLDGQLHHHGAILFRGFDVSGAQDFNRFAATIGGGLKSYVGGDSPRREVDARVYTSTEFAADLEIYLHNELSYSNWYPARVFFYCHVSPGGGGQTNIGDSRRIYRGIAPKVAERFAERGVAYLQNLHGGVGVGKSWQDTYETDDRDQVEAHCRAHGVEFRWTRTGLWTRTVRDAVLDHPVTGERAWFNQADQFHALAPGPRVDPTIAERFERGDWPCHATYGDGSEIDVGDLMEIRRAFAAEEVLFAWQRGDVLMLDNLIAAHGRKPYTGERKILVAMS